MSKLYVRGIVGSVRDRDIEGLFSKYGKIVNLEMKHGFCFVEFEDRRDADDALHEINGTSFMGGRLSVELSYSSQSNTSRPKPVPGEGRCFKCGVEGHWARECPDPLPRRDGAANSRRYSRGNARSRSPPENNAGRGRSKSRSRSPKRNDSSRDRPARLPSYNDRDRDRGRDSRPVERDRPFDKERERLPERPPRDRERERDRDFGRDRDPIRDRDTRDRDVGRDRDRDIGRDRDRGRDFGRGDRDRERDRGRIRDNGRDNGGRDNRERYDKEKIDRDREFKDNERKIRRRSRSRSRSPSRKDNFDDGNRRRDRPSQQPDRNRPPRDLNLPAEEENHLE